MGEWAWGRVFEDVEDGAVRGARFVPFWLAARIPDLRL